MNGEARKALHSFDQAAQLLGGISHWTLRKHAARGNVSLVRIGRRCFLSDEEVRRIEVQGLPSLGRSDAEKREHGDEL